MGKLARGFCATASGARSDEAGALDLLGIGLAVSAIPFLWGRVHAIRQPYPRERYHGRTRPSQPHCRSERARAAFDSDPLRRRVRYISHDARTRVMSGDPFKQRRGSRNRMRTHVRVFDAEVARTRSACILARSCTTEIAGCQATDAASRVTTRPADARSGSCS